MSGGNRRFPDFRQARRKSEQAGRRARCVPDRTVNRGHSRSLTDRRNTPPTCISSGQRPCTRSLPSWSCGFDSRHPLSLFVVDELSLYRQVGSAEVMSAQLRRLLDIAALPTVTVQVMPAVAHASNNSGFMIADDSVAWCEHAAAGYVFTEPETVRTLALRFDTLRAESYRASESTALFREMTGRWATGVSPLTAMRPAASA
jgi:Domain of unknown function (DUF5753)